MRGFNGASLDTRGLFSFSDGVSRLQAGTPWAQGSRVDILVLLEGGNYGLFLFFLVWPLWAHPGIGRRGGEGAAPRWHGGPTLAPPPSFFVVVCACAC